jgi:PHD/YefM family antitoxin component YafN of YafNO toxin-antitoxin module
MVTKFIGVKDFRQNMSTYAKKAQTNKVRLVVMNRNKPLFEITPFSLGDTYDSLYARVEKARSEVSKGKFHTSTDIAKSLGL